MEEDYDIIVAETYGRLEDDIIPALEAGDYEKAKAHVGYLKAFIEHTAKKLIEDTAPEVK